MKIFSKISSFWAVRSKLSKVIILILGGLISVWLILFALVPRTLFSTPYSTLLYSADKQLLGARIANDGQWRFPINESIPDKFSKCITTYEDRRFWWHLGVDPIAIIRAVRQNIKAGEVVSGGSTLTMQVARLARGNRERNLYEKTVESLWSLYLESRYSKRRIMSLYCAHAPFGGNVVGLETASWRYFGRSADQLSWAESAMLAVLPNSPALIHPGRNRQVLKAKRDTLLRQLLGRGIIDTLECELGALEPLPKAPLPLPNSAPHLMERLAQTHSGERIETSLNHALQVQVQQIVDRTARINASNHIYNMAALIADVHTGEVLAYVGNVSFEAEPRFGNSVDIITSPRSTGSVLKPLLYAGMLHDGLILPRTLIADTPLNINGFTPQNYNKTFHGVVPAHRAIERSLNVPLVRMLSSYNTGRFMNLMKSYGVTTLRFSDEHYGASLILGGAEGTLWDLVGMYGSMSRTLNNFRRYNGRYNPADIHPLTPYPAKADPDPINHPSDRRLIDRPTLSAASIWFAYQAMSALNRPEEEADWQQFSSMKQVAWKTGTSYGGRDAWAVGTTPKYVIGVWAGNSSGEGRSALSGVGTAAPVLFDLYSLLPAEKWFEIPYDEMQLMPICKQSGHKASSICEGVDTLYMPLSGVESDVCPYHHIIHTTLDGRFRVNSSCEELDKMVSRSWFTLPPTQEYFYRSHNSDYAPLPPLRAGCGGNSSRQIELIYPEHGAILYLPKGFSGTKEFFVFKAAHARDDAALYWHIDQHYLGQTEREHSITCAIEAGKHLLTVTDKWGNQRKVVFEVVDAPQKVVGN